MERKETSFSQAGEVFLGGGRLGRYFLERLVLELEEQASKRGVFHLFEGVFFMAGDEGDILSRGRGALMAV